MAKSTAPMSATEMVAALDQVVQACREQFGETNPARVAQVEQHVATAAMAVEHLHTETPFVIGA